MTSGGRILSTLGQLQNILYQKLYLVRSRLLLFQLGAPLREIVLVNDERYSLYKSQLLHKGGGYFKRQGVFLLPPPSP